MNAPAKQLWVLVGGDYSGKTRLMRKLRSRNRLSLVSCDDEFLPDAYRSVSPLRSLFLQDVLPRSRSMFSADYVLSGLQMAIVYQRDCARAELNRNHVLLDSYCYKIVAKSRLLGMINEHMFEEWRSFLRPDCAIFLRTSPEVAYERAAKSAELNAQGFGQAGNAANLNAFEHDGPIPERSAFLGFQARLQDAMLQELSGIRIHVVDGDRSANDVLTEVETLLPRNTYE